MLHKGLLVRVNGEVSVVEFSNEYGSNEDNSISYYVGGYIESARSDILVKCIKNHCNKNSDICIILNEEGKIHGLNTNKVATLLYDGFMVGDFVVGDVVIVKVDVVNVLGEMDFVGLDDDEIVEIVKVIDKIKKD
jgi:hypothetical protein